MKSVHMSVSYSLIELENLSRVKYSNKYINSYRKRQLKILSTGRESHSKFILLVFGPEN